MLYFDVNARAQAQVYQAHLQVQFLSPFVRISNFHKGPFNRNFGHLWTCFKAKTMRDRLRPSWRRIEANYWNLLTFDRPDLQNWSIDSGRDSALRCWPLAPRRRASFLFHCQLFWIANFPISEFSITFWQTFLLYFWF